jgi:hypothetical protein
VDRKHRVIIASHSPRRQRLIVGAGAAALALTAFGIYSYTRATTVSDFERARTERDQLADERRALSRDLRMARAENQALKEQVAYLGRSQEIDGAACGSVKQSLTSLQAEASDLREQLAFYRGIVSPQESQAGVRVYDFKVAKTLEANLYKFDLVLIQSVRNDKRTGGNIEVTLEGLRGTQKQTLRLKELVTDPKPDMVFSFKYFEEFSGGFQLPEGFRPLRAVVSLEPQGEGVPTVEDEYEWGKIIQEARAT